MKPMNIKFSKGIGAIVMATLILMKLSGCETECAKSIEEGDEVIIFAIKDKNTGEYLFKENNQYYHIDTLKIFDQNNAQLGEYDYSYFRYGSLGYKFNINNIYESGVDPDPRKQEVCKKYYLYLAYTDTDTLETCFTGKVDECLTFDQFNVLYNDSLIFTGGGDAVIEFDILK